MVMTPSGPLSPTCDPSRVLQDAHSDTLACTHTHTHKYIHALALHNYRLKITRYVIIHWNPDKTKLQCQIFRSQRKIYNGLKYEQQRNGRECSLSRTIMFLGQK